MNFIHAHLILNHLPLAGILFGFLLLQWGVFCRDAGVQKSALLMLLGTALLSIAVFVTGDLAAEIAPLVLGLPNSLIERHEEAATVALWVTILVGALSGWALWDARRDLFPRPRALQFIALVALVSFGLIGWASFRGGQIRHSEIQPDWKETGGKL